MVDTSKMFVTKATMEDIVVAEFNNENDENS